MARDKFEHACAGCGKPIPLEWDNGVILPAGVLLIADWVFHDECWVDPPEPSAESATPSPDAA